MASQHPGLVRPQTSYLTRRCLVLIHFVSAAAVGLGVGAAGDRAALTVLDGDGLQGSGLGEGQRLRILSAGAGGITAVGGVIDRGTVGTRDRYLNTISELSLTGELRSGQRCQFRVRGSWFSVGISGVSTIRGAVVP